MRAAFWTFCAALSLTALIGVGRQWAEGEEKRPPKPRTRIGLFNLEHVSKNCNRCKADRVTIREALTPFQKTDAELRQRAESLREKKQAPDLSAKRKEKIERELKLLQRKIEDNNAEVKQVLGKMTEEMLKAIYLDVQEVTKRYAVAHDLDLVLHYNDPPPDDEAMSPLSIQRKTTDAGLRPLYSAPGIDISKDILDLLNQNEKSTR